MDNLNDYYPLYPPNPDTVGLSDSDISENNVYVSKLEKINNNRKRKKEYCFDDFCLVHSDNLWYLWCILNEFTDTNHSPLLNKLSYNSFCAMCYQNSSKT